jgi:hypothetical protein
MTLSVLTIARKCLDIRGPFSIRQDVFTHQRPASLRSGLEIIHKTRCKPEAPTALRVELTTAGRIDLRWVDNSDNETGFYIRFRGKRIGFDDHTGTSGTNTDIAYASLTGLRSGFTYTIRVLAYNQAGESPPSNEVQATTPNVAETQRVQLRREVIVQGPVPYAGKFPVFGIVPAGRLLRMRLPQLGFPDVALAFVKRGHSTQECNNPSAVVVIGEGQTTTPAQLREIYGVDEPRFTTHAPIPFIACYRTTNPSSPLPDPITIEIEVIFDMT